MGSVFAFEDLNPVSSLETKVSTDGGGFGLPRLFQTGALRVLLCLLKATGLTETAGLDTIALEADKMRRREKSC